MLPCLGHNAIIGRHYQKGNIDGGHSRHHIADKFLVTGNINNGDRFIQESKPQVDGHAPGFFLRQPVGVCAGERFDQGGLSVVNMPGSADDNLGH